MDEDLRAQVRRLQDRQDIHDCLTRYCRAVDRLDRDLLMSVYHDDAIDDHGLFFGSGAAFVDWVLPFHARLQTSTQHVITNHTCDLDGDVAHTETYFLFAGMNRDGPPFTLAGGRYIDRFERRDGRWAIALRKCVNDWRSPTGPSFLPVETQALYALVGHWSRDAEDLSYDRPLEVDRSRPAFQI